MVAVEHTGAGRGDVGIEQRRRIGRVHLVGIGGAGMSGIAEVLLELGYPVSGSDARASDATRRLTDLGVDVRIGHDAKAVRGAQVVVVSSAVTDDNVEVQAARAAHLPVVPRAQMLGELMRFRNGIAVAGTHGKTTTTSLITHIFEAAGRDPTFVIGGVLTSAGTNARLGQSSWFIAEADESDASFLHLQPLLAVITNIDRDHLGTYGGDFEQLKDTFVSFSARLPFYGRLVACIDDPQVADIVPRLTRPFTTYGLSEVADVRGFGLERDGAGTRFRVLRPQRAVLEVSIALPGRHNVANALAAIAVASEADIDDDAIVAGLAACRGVSRRFEVHEGMRIGAAPVTLVDDYGHHPTEVAAVVATARDLWPERRLVMVFQPHRYTRTHELFDDFVRVLANVDVLAVVGVYAAGEAEISGADAGALCRSIRQRGRVDPVLFADTVEAQAGLGELVQPGDVVITQGAGDIAGLSRALRGLDELV